MRKIKVKELSMWEEKICPKCNDKKSVFEFTFDRTKKDGLSRICRECKKLARIDNSRHN